MDAALKREIDAALATEPLGFYHAQELLNLLLALSGEVPSGSPEDLALLDRRAELNEWASARGWHL